MSMPILALNPRRKSTTQKDWVWFLYSFLGHIAFLGTLFLVSGINPFDFAKHVFNAIPQKPEEKKAGYTSEQLIDVRPFEGITYTEYARQKKQRTDQKATANAVLSKLKGLKFGGANVEKTNDSGLALEGPAKSQSSLTALVSKQDFAVRSASIQQKEGIRKMTDNERAELKKKFRELEREFRKAYAQALNADSNLSVTVAFEAEVQSSGYLSVAHFKVRGRYQPESISQLQKAMSQLISQVFVAQDLRGTLIRGESVFMK